jgi:hypothetical protein
LLRTVLKCTLILKEITCTENMGTGCLGKHLDSERSKKQEAEELRNENSIVQGSFSLFRYQN